MIIPVLAVQDVDASVAFYTTKLGFETLYVIAGAGDKSGFAAVKLGDQNQLAFEAIDATPPVGNGVVLMIYPPEEVNLDQFYSDVQNRGVVMSEPLHDAYWGDRTFTVNDPDGYVLMFAATVRQVPMYEIETIMKQGPTLS